MKRTLDRARELYAAEMDNLDEPEEDRAILGTVRLIGGGLVLMIVVVLLLTEIHGVIAPSANNGPFSSVISSVEGTGVAALTLLVVGFLVIAASAIMRYFGGGFGGGGR